MILARVNRYMLIPLVLNLLALIVIPTIFAENTFAKAALLTVAALAWPWVLYFLIGSAVSHAIQSDARALSSALTSASR